jgi:hypothetical protein
VPGISSPVLEIKEAVMEFKHSVGDCIYLVIRQYDDYKVNWYKQTIQDRRINNKGVDQYLVGCNWLEDETSSGEYFKQICTDEKQLPHVILKHYAILKQRLDEKTRYVDEQIVKYKRETMAAVTNEDAK